MQTPWTRLEQVIKMSGLSTHKFAHTIGIKRAENLYQIKRGSFGISKELSGLITKKYPEINRAWLLTGDGEMLVGASAAGIEPDTVVPVYNIEVAQLYNTDIKKLTVDHNISIKVDGDFALNCRSNSMTPEIPVGATVVVEKVAVSDYMPGLPYLVVTKNFSAIKILRTVATDDTSLLLQSRNSAEYDDIVLPKDKITKLYALKAIINIIA